METGPATAAPDSSSTDLAVTTAIQKLKQQNQTLKTELQQLRSSLESTLKSLKNGEREQLRPNFSQGQNSELEALVARIQECKKECNTLRLHLAARDDNKVAELENQVAYLKSKLAELDAERDSLKSVEKRQIEALQALENNSELQRLTKGMKAEIDACIEKEKAAKLKIAKSQAEWNAVHQQMVALEERYREVQRRRPGDQTPEEEAKNKELAEWQKKVDVLEKSSTSDEKLFKMKLKELEQKRKEAEDEKSRLDGEISRLNQDIPLKELKQKELKTRQSQLQKRNAELLQVEAERQAREKEPVQKPADPQSTLFAATQLEENA